MGWEESTDEKNAGLLVGCPLRQKRGKWAPVDSGAVIDFGGGLWRENRIKVGLGVDWGRRGSLRSKTSGWSWNLILCEKPLRLLSRRGNGCT